ncbi:MAG: TetR/AcrR family transcriptional regulator [Myxococcota bacterium]
MSRRFAPWSPPVQARSRARVDAILTAARDLVVEQGIAELKMTDVAKRADVPIGSLYQYFPIRQALIARLFEVETRVLDETIGTALEKAMSRREMINAVDYVIHRNLALIHERPYLRTLWSSPGVHPHIRQLELQNLRANALLISEKFCALPGPKLDPEAVMEAWALVCHLSAEVARLSCDVANGNMEGDFANRFVAMVQDHMGRFLEPGDGSDKAGGVSER